MNSSIDRQRPPGMALTVMSLVAGELRALESLEAFVSSLLRGTVLFQLLRTPPKVPTAIPLSL